MPATFLFEPAPNAEAVAFIRDKLPLRADDFAKLLPELQARAFTVAGIESHDALQSLRDTLATVPQGADYEKVKKAVAATLAQHLPLRTDLFDPTPEEAAALKAKLERRAEFIARNTVNAGYGRAAFAELHDQKDIFPYWKYLSMEDLRVRPTHAALNGMILRADNAFWQTHFPPWEWMCRCTVVGVMQYEVDEQAEAEKDLPEEQRMIITGAALERLETERTLVRSIEGTPVKLDLRAPIEKQVEHPYVFQPQTLAMPLNDVLARYSAPQRQAFIAWAKATPAVDGKSIYEWLGGADTSARKLKVAAKKLPKEPKEPKEPKDPVATKEPKEIPTENGKPKTENVSHPSGLEAFKAENLVSAKLDVPKRGVVKQALTPALEAINQVHGDGPLHISSVRQSPGTSGVYRRAYKADGSGGLAFSETSVSWGKDNETKTSQIVHEIGHKIDFETLGAGHSLTRQETPEMLEFHRAVGDSQAVLNLRTLGRYRLDPDYQHYQLKPVELWARAYAQFIAEESAHPLLVEDIEKRRSGRFGYWADSQWSAEDFGPIRAAMRAIFRALKWML